MHRLFSVYTLVAFLLHVTTLTVPAANPANSAAVYALPQTNATNNTTNNTTTKNTTNTNTTNTTTPIYYYYPPLDPKTDNAYIPINYYSPPPDPQTDLAYLGLKGLCDGSKPRTLNVVTVNELTAEEQT